MMAKTRKQKNKYPVLALLLAKAKVLVLPGFDNIPLGVLAEFFTEKVQADMLTVRARSVAFTFLLAIFPATIFLFSLIPYIPVPHLQENMINIIREMTPNSIFSLLQKAIVEAASKQRGGLLSFGLIMTLFISTNGTLGLMASFDKASEFSVRRSLIRKRIVALQLTIILFVLLLFSIALIVAGNKLLLLGLRTYHIATNFNVLLFTTLKYLIILFLFFNSISIIYRYGPAHRKRWKFISPGSTMATILSVCVSIGFSFFVNKFGGPSRLFGSLGAIIALQIWIYLNSFALLMGFELNVAIEQNRFKSLVASESAKK